MCKKIITLVLLIALGAGAQQERPKRSNPFKSKQFWITLGIRTGLAIADAESTVTAQRRNPLFSEANPLFSNKPSRGELYSKGAAIEAGLTLLTAAIWRKSETAGRTFDALHTGMRAIAHTIAIDNNLSGPTACPANQVRVNGVCQ